MKTSLDPVFLTNNSDFAALRDEISTTNSWGRMRHAIGKTDFNTAYDFFRTLALEHYQAFQGEEAMRIIADTDALIMRAGSEDGHLLNIHAALMQILTALRIEQGMRDQAMTSAAATLTLLAQQPKRKDEPFLQILAMLLYDIALLHSDVDKYKQAEREVEKSAKIFERLARLNPQRYGSAHLMSLNAVTGIYRSRVKQTNLLTQYNASTSLYLKMLNDGMEDAATRLIDSLASEARVLAEMDRHREAVQFYIRALKYLTRMESTFTVHQLELSVAMAQSMLHVKVMHDKAIHLLNTMQHKAIKLNHPQLHSLILNLLNNDKTHGLDILGFWHKLFPR